METPIVDRIIDEIFDSSIGSKTLAFNADLGIDEAIEKTVNTYLNGMLEFELDNFGQEIIDELGLSGIDPAILKQAIQRKLNKLISSKIKPYIQVSNTAFSDLKEGNSPNKNQFNWQVLCD
jgi:hypothetical protein